MLKLLNIGCRVGPRGIRHRLFHVTAFNPELVKFHLSDIGEGIKEVTVKEWFVQVGDNVNQFDQLCEVQSDKASVTITSRYDGVIKKLYFDVDQIAQTGDALVDILTEDSALAGATEEKQEDTQPDVAPVRSKGKSSALATPAVRRIAAEHNISLSDIHGTGKDGRVLKEDLLVFIGQPGVVETLKRSPTPVPPLVDRKPPPAPVQPTRKYVASTEDRVEPLKGIQKAMMKSMTEALKIPHFGYSDEIEMTNLVRLRKELKPVTEMRGINLSYLPFIIKSCSLSLKEFPILNSLFDSNAESMTIKADHNIGVAMDTAQGLLVPNIKAVQNLSVIEIAEELNRIHCLGLNGKLGDADLKGGTISLSNIGSIGGTYAKPVILPPQVAIAALGKVHQVPKFDKDGNVVAANIMNISWSCDHRVLDGATVARFSNAMKSYIEKPELMVLALK